MQKEPNLRLVGVFMVTGVVALVAIAAAYIQRHFFADDENMLVMYFEESIKGLNVGSSVVFKGVEIGKVAKVDLIADPDTMDFSIPVYAKMETYQGIYSRQTYTSKQEILNALIAKGLRARLTSQSYLTGQLMIELEMLPDTPIVLKNKSVDGDVLEIPTALSPIGEISKGIQNLPIKQSVEQFNQFFTELNRQLPIVMPEVKNTFTSINKVVKDNSRTSTDMLDNFNKAAINISEAAKTFRNFADYIERHPEALLKGKGGR